MTKSIISILSCIVAQPIIASTAVGFISLNQANSEFIKKNDSPKCWFPVSSDTGFGQYEATFDVENGTCKISGLKLFHDVNFWKIPPYLIEPNSQKKCRVVSLGIRGNYNKDVQAGDKFYIHIIDLQEAKFLTEIEDDCFNREQSDKDAPRISYVNFLGARSLKRIGARAFHWQFFSHKIANEIGGFQDLDFSQTKIETIGERAFQAATSRENPHKQFRNIYFPKTLTCLQQYAFASMRNDNNLQFDNMIFGISADQIEYNKDIFNNNQCLPKLKNKGKHICCENEEQKKAWNDIKNPFSKQSDTNITAESLFASTISFAADGKGSTTIYGVHGEGGVDSKTWKLAKDTSRSSNDAGDIKVELSNDYNKKIWLDKIPNKDEYRLAWSKDLKPGLYNVNVRASIDNPSTAGDNSMISSETIDLYIVDYSLQGGTTYNYVSKFIPYKDSHDWRLSIACDDYLLEPDNISKVEYTLNKPSDFYGEAKVETKSLETWDKNSANVSFDISSLKVPLGTSYAFDLCAKIYFSNNSNVVVKQTIYLIASDTAWTANIENEYGEQKDEYKLQYSSTDTTKTLSLKLNFNSLKGELPAQEILKCCKSSFSNDAAIKIDRDNPTKQGSTYTYNLSINYGSDDGCLHPGIYTFYIYFPITIENVTIPVYSNEVKLIVSRLESSVNMDDFKLTNGNTVLSTIKKTYGHDSQPWHVQTASGWSYSKTEFNHTDWTKDPTRTSNIFTHTKSQSNNEFYIYWNDKFCTNSDWYDIYDCNMVCFVKNNSTNEELTIIQPISFTSTNYGKVLTECPYLVNGTRTQPGENNNPWLLEINSDRSLNTQPTIFEIDYSASGLTKDQLWLEEIPDTNTVKLCWSGSIPKGYYPFSIVASSEEYFVSSTSTLHFLAITNDIKLVDVPTVINTVKGEKNSIEKPVSTYINGSKTEKAIYSLTNAPTGVSIDKNTGVISWDGTTPIGTHQIIVVSTVEDEGYDPDVAYAVVPFVVTAAPTISKNKSILILAGTGVGALGLGIGLTCAVKAIHNKRKNNNNKKRK